MKIICLPTPWFYKRAISFCFLLGFFSFLFFKDGLFSYPKKNEAFLMFHIFERAGKKYDSLNTNNRLIQKNWDSFLSEQKEFLSQQSLILPKGMDFSKFPPQELNQFHQIGKKGWHNAWKDYSYQKKFPLKPSEKKYSKSDLKEQIFFGFFCGISSIFLLFFILRISRKSCFIDDKKLQIATVDYFKYDQVQKLDLKKWDNKGIAFFFLQKDNKELKLKFDGFIYGGFEGEDGGKAEQFIQKFQSKFQGEIIK